MKIEDDKDKKKCFFKRLKKNSMYLLANIMLNTHVNYIIDQFFSKNHMIENIEYIQNDKKFGNQERSYENHLKILTFLVRSIWSEKYKPNNFNCLELPTTFMNIHLIKNKKFNRIFRHNIKLASETLKLIYENHSIWDIENKYDGIIDGSMYIKSQFSKVANDIPEEVKPTKIPQILHILRKNMKCLYKNINLSIDLDNNIINNIIVTEVIYDFIDKDINKKRSKGKYSILYQL